jgi:L-aminopeptidase/D-esterase-like protein
MRYLEEQGAGFDTGIAKIPLVPGAILFDLVLGDATARPDSQMGYLACQQALQDNLQQGNAGAGCGATVGKVGGPATMMKGGLGTASWGQGDLVVGAIVAVNCLGDVLDPVTGRILAGTLTPDRKEFAGSMKILCNAPKEQKGFPTNTTIGIVATNARLTKAMATRVAVMAHDGFARSIQPAHTLSDGDTIFCLSTGDKTADVTTIGAIAAMVTARAVVQGITHAEGLHGVPAHRDMR